MKQFIGHSRRVHPRRPIVRIKIGNGRFQTSGLGAWYTYWRDPYHLLLTVPWSGFLAIIVFAYLSINAFFAILYSLQPGGIAHAPSGSFVDTFFFSVQTVASIGYGTLYPQTLYTNIIMTLEAMTGLVGISVMTGLAFARFSRPTARVLFSRVAVITTYDGVPVLMFRSANRRRNQILEAQMQVYLMRDEINLEGQTMRRFHELRLLRHRNPTFTLSWTAIHPIDENSPLYGATLESLIQSRTTIVVSLNGVDETVAQAIHARHTYTVQDLLWNHRFVDIFYGTTDGDRYIDYNLFHETIPLE